MICAYIYTMVIQKFAKWFKQNILRKKGWLDDSFGGVNNSYSFVLPPRSIQKVKCEFLLSIPNSEIGKYLFDKIDLKYYDEKTMKNIWNKGLQKVDEEWIIIE